MCSPQEEIKIYSGSEKTAAGPSEGEKSAKQFIANRDNGNFDKARQLGELLARTMMGDFDRLENQDFCREKLVLLSYIAVSELRKRIPVVMLQKSAEGAFNNTIETLNPEVFSEITDSAAFSFYFLNERQGMERSDGAVFAQLCSRQDDEALCEQGDSLAEEYRALFARIIGSYRFKEL